MQVSFGEKITDFRLIIEVVDCGALGINELRTKPNARIGLENKVFMTLRGTEFQNAFLQNSKGFVDMMFFGTEAKHSQPDPKNAFNGGGGKKNLSIIPHKINQIFIEFIGIDVVWHIPEIGHRKRGFRSGFEACGFDGFMKIPA